MKVEVLADAEAVARRAAGFIAMRARTAVAARGRFTLAVSGGRTPWRMLRLLAAENMPWDAVHLFQVDERVAPAGDAERNWTQIDECLIRHSRLLPENLHAMPVDAADLAAAAADYGRDLVAVAGTPPEVDLIHLGLGNDGHTASLVPGDPVLDVVQADVALTGSYQGRRRMTLTLPMLDRARCILWLVTGREKAPMLARLRASDRSIPAGRVECSRALILADTAAGQVNIRPPRRFDPGR